MLVATTARISEARAAHTFRDHFRVANRLVGMRATFNRSIFRPFSSEMAFSSQLLASNCVHIQLDYQVSLQRPVDWYCSICRLP